MEKIDFEIVKKGLGVRFSSFLEKNNISPYKLALKFYDKTNNTPSNLKNGKHLPNFEFLYLLKHYYINIDLNWLVYGDQPPATQVNEPPAEYGNKEESDIMLVENQKLIKVKLELLKENNLLKDKLLKCYECMIKKGINPEITETKTATKEG